MVAEAQPLLVPTLPHPPLPLPLPEWRITPPRSTPPFLPHPPLCLFIRTRCSLSILYCTLIESISICAAQRSGASTFKPIYFAFALFDPPAPCTPPLCLPRTLCPLWGKMTAKHRKGKNNYKHEDNFFKNDVTETEVRGGGNNIALHLVLFLLIVICGATGSWFCFQQHQTLTYLTDNLMGMQMKIVKLQSSHEDMRQSNNQQQASESMEIRLNALEDSYALAQKQAGMALATAEQLRTSDLPAQVMSLHTEMKNRLAEMQQATVSLEQLSQLQSMLRGKSEEFEVVRIQVEGLSTLSDQLSQKVEGLTGSMGEAESKLDEVATLSASMDGQAAEVQMLKQQLENYQAQLEASTLEMANVRGLIENEQLQQGSVEEQIDTPVEETVEEVAPAVEEEAAAAPEEVEELPADVEEEASNTEAAGEESEEEAAAQEVAPVELEDSVTDEAAPAEDAEEEESAALSEKTEEEESVEETQEAEEVVSEGDGGLEEKEVLEEEEEEEEQQDVAAEEEAEETDEEEEPLENDASPEDE